MGVWQHICAKFLSTANIGQTELLWAQKGFFEKIFPV